MECCQSVIVRILVCETQATVTVPPNIASAFRSNGSSAVSLFLTPLAEEATLELS